MSHDRHLIETTRIVGVEVNGILPTGVFPSITSKHPLGREPPLVTKLQAPLHLTTMPSLNPSQLARGQCSDGTWY